MGPPAPRLETHDSISTIFCRYKFPKRLIAILQNARLTWVGGVEPTPVVRDIKLWAEVNCPKTPGPKILLDIRISFVNNEVKRCEVSHNRPTIVGPITSTLTGRSFFILGEKGGYIMKTRIEFLEAVMKMANFKDLKQADAAARAVISLTKLIIGEELSQKIAEASPPDLRQGWESIRAAQSDDFERDEMLFETGEVSEG